MGLTAARREGGSGYSIPAGLVHMLLQPSPPQRRPSLILPTPPSCQDAGMEGCSDGTIHRPPLPATGEFNSSRNHQQSNPAGGYTIKGGLAAATAPCLLPARPRRPLSFPSTVDEVILAEPGYSGEDGGRTGSERLPRLPRCQWCTRNQLKPGTFGLERRQGALNGNCETQPGLNPLGAFQGMGFAPGHGPFQMPGGSTV